MPDSERIEAIRVRAAKWTALPLDADPELPEQVIRFLLAEVDRGCDDPAVDLVVGTWNDRRAE